LAGAAVAVFLHRFKGVSFFDSMHARRRAEGRR
jgi:hypothetical protein